MSDVVWKGGREGGGTDRVRKTRPGCDVAKRASVSNLRRQVEINDLPTWLAVVTFRMILKAGWRVGNPDDILERIGWYVREG